MVYKSDGWIWYNNPIYERHRKWRKTADGRSCRMSSGVSEIQKIKEVKRHGDPEAGGLSEGARQCRTG